MSTFIYLDTSFIRYVMDLIDIYSRNDFAELYPRMIINLDNEFSKYKNNCILIIHLKVLKEIKVIFQSRLEKYVFKTTPLFPIADGAKIPNRNRIDRELKHWGLSIRDLQVIIYSLDSLFKEYRKLYNNNLFIQVLIHKFVEKVLELLLMGEFNINRYPLCNVCIEAERDKKVRSKLIRVTLSCSDLDHIKELSNNPECLEDYHISIAVCCLAVLYKNYDILERGCSGAQDKGNIVYILVSSPPEGNDWKCFYPVNNEVFVCRKNTEFINDACEKSYAKYKIVFFNPIVLHKS